MITRRLWLVVPLPADDSAADNRRYAAADALSILLKTSKSTEEAKALVSDDVAALLA